GTKAAAANKAYADALAKLPPATRETAKAFLGLRSDFSKWSDSLAPQTMPVFTKGINILRSLLPALTPLVTSAATALGFFMDEIAKGVAGGGPKRFFAELAQASDSVLPSLLGAMKNIVIGIAGVIRAFLPASAQLSGGFERLTRKFADFGQGLSNNQAFQEWMADVSDQAPDLLDMLGDLIQIIVNVAEALGPFTGLTLKITAALADFVAAIPQDTMDWLAPTIMGIVLAIKAWSVVQGILNIALAANPIGLVVIAIAALVGGLIYAYKHSETFRRLVDGAFSTAKEAGQDLWDKIRPGLERMGELLGETLPEAAAILAGTLGELADKAKGVAEEILGINGSLEKTPESGSSVIDWFKENWEPVLAGMLTGPLGGAVVAVLDHFNVLTTVFQSFSEVLREKWRDMWRGTARAAFDWLERIREGVHKIVGRVVHAFLSPWPGAQKRFDRLWS
ncbi:MAG: hypothetical protein ACRDXB_05050, partial [Actinomycetes bacterium]